MSGHYSFPSRPSRRGRQTEGRTSLLRAYEVVIVLSPALEEEAVVAFLDRVKQAIEGTGGSVEGVDRWGRRRLAYEINDQTEGQYVLARFQAESRSGTSELEHLCRISEPVLRHLIVVREETEPARSVGLGVQEAEGAAAPTSVAVDPPAFVNPPAFVAAPVAESAPAAEEDAPAADGAPVGAESESE